MIRCRLFLQVILTAGVLAPVLLAQNMPMRWKQFVSQGGWQIKYPGGWKIGTCVTCVDPHHADVDVDFSDVGNRGRGQEADVEVSPFADKRNGVALEKWFSEIELTGGKRVILSRHRFSLNGLPALRVRYAEGLSADSPQQSETVFVVADQHTLMISFAESASGPVEKQPDYPIYEMMLESFSFGAEGSR